MSTSERRATGNTGAAAISPCATAAPTGASRRRWNDARPCGPPGRREQSAPLACRCTSSIRPYATERNPPEITLAAGFSYLEIDGPPGHAERPHLVVPEIEAIATPMLEELEAAGTVRVIPTARAARLTMDREGIRVLAAETLGLPTSPYQFCNSLEELQAAIDAGIGYPCI
eukprot:gene48401-65665_t